jgi:hypothetical protein
MIYSFSSFYNSSEPELFKINGHISIKISGAPFT